MCRVSLLLREQQSIAGARLGGGRTIAATEPWAWLLAAARYRVTPGPKMKIRFTAITTRATMPMIGQPNLAVTCCT